MGMTVVMSEELKSEKKVNGRKENSSILFC